MLPYRTFPLLAALVLLLAGCLKAEQKVAEAETLPAAGPRACPAPGQRREGGDMEIQYLPPGPVTPPRLSEFLRRCHPVTGFEEARLSHFGGWLAQSYHLGDGATLTAIFDGDGHFLRLERHRSPGLPDWLVAVEPDR
ncbi:MAG: hypothetical protein KIT20_14495 [Alphaproteobacteria bacterium]|nr:hypothetical protein [Alphaproteobacteria bacterium]